MCSGIIKSLASKTGLHRGSCPRLAFTRITGKK
nr:MAG TPA: hypothetical protein [Bacteriophage sp.]